MRTITIIACCFTLFSISCNNGSGTDKEFRITKDDSLSSIKPGKSVRIQLKRNTKGKYSWDIKGDDVEQIIETDRKLKNSIITNDKEAGR